MLNAINFKSIFIIVNEGEELTILLKLHVTEAGSKKRTLHYMRPLSLQIPATRFRQLLSRGHFRTRLQAWHHHPPTFLLPEKAFHLN